MNGDWYFERESWRAKRWLWSGAAACAAGAVVSIAAIALPGDLSEWTRAILWVFWTGAVCFAWAAVRYLLRARARGG